MTFNPKTHTAVSISALESMGKMVKQLQDSHDKLRMALRNVTNAYECEVMREHGLGGFEYATIVDARKTLAACTESKV